MRGIGAAANRPVDGSTAGTVAGTKALAEPATMSRAGCDPERHTAAAEIATETTVLEAAPLRDASHEGAISAPSLERQRQGRGAARN